MSSGGGGTSTNTVQSSNAFIPDWLSSYGQQAVERANQLSQNPYVAYGGQTVAAPDAAQQQAYNQIGGLQGFGAGSFGSAINPLQGLADQTSPITTGGVQGGTNALQQGFMDQVYGPSQGLLAPFSSQGPATAAGVGANAQALMSPYTSSVIDPANQLMRQQLQQNLGTIGANANQAGAFGGSRQGVMEGVAQSQAALGSEKYLGDLLNSQWGNALTQGGSIAAQNATQGLAANTALANLMQGGYGANQQLSADIASKNLNAGITGAQAIPGQLTSLQNLLLGQNQALNAAGQQQQQYQQNLLNAAQGAFAQQQAFPYQQLQTLLGAVSGIPYSTSNTMFQQDFSPMYSNPYGQAIGGAAALGGLAGGAGSILNSNAFGGSA